MKIDSVVLQWISFLTYKQQTVLLTAIRGCDVMDKYDLSKKFVRKLRKEILHDADPSSSRFIGDDDITFNEIQRFVESLDKYPFHFVMHYVNACEIIGYFHPETSVREWWLNLYLKFVKAFHLYPESKEACLIRLQDYV